MIIVLASLVWLTHAALPPVPDHFTVRVHPPRMDQPCELRFTRVTTTPEWANTPSHWVEFDPGPSARLPSGWTSDPKLKNELKTWERWDFFNLSFTLEPEGLINTYDGTHGELLRDLLGTHSDEASIQFPDKHVRAKTFFAAQSAADQKLIRAAARVLKTGAGGNVLNARWLIPHHIGALPLGAHFIFPASTAPRGLMVMPYLDPLHHDFIINFHYRAGTLQSFVDHWSAILPVILTPKVAR